MTAETLKSAAITGYDTVPPTKPTAGSGAAGGLIEVSGYVTNTAGKTTGSIYKLVRLNRAVYVKSIDFETAAVGSNAAFSIGAYYSDAPLSGVDDGTQLSLAGTVISADFFANAIDPTSAVGITNETNQSGSYTIDLRQEPLWQALGITSDPGGFIDICITTGGTATNAAEFGVSVRYTTSTT